MFRTSTSTHPLNHHRSTALRQSSPFFAVGNMFPLLYVIYSLALIDAVISKSPSNGHLCMTVEHFKAGNDEHTFYECSPFMDDEVKEYKIGAKNMGTWNLRSCPRNFTFVEHRQRCLEKHSYRRQQASCEQNADSIGCRRKCQAESGVPRAGSPCDWLSEDLRPDPKSKTQFFQCAPQGYGQACGQWVQRQCKPETVFNPSLQICTAVGIQQSDASACQPGSNPVCSCAQSSSIQTCPGASSCQQAANVCCQPGETGPLASPEFPLDMPLNQAIIVCPISYAVPVAPCSPVVGCPSGSACSLEIGFCCPLPQPQPQPQPQPFPQPLPQPMPQPQTLPAPRPIPVISQYCPDGSRPPQGCGPNGLCPQGYGCFQGGCCPLRCPNGQNQAGICIQITTNCAQSGDCCPAAVPHIALPVCPSGQKASSFCTVERGCGPGMECSSGGCCPMPFCPNGVQATGRCLFGSGCRALSMCIDGLCCPLPQCPTGTLAVRVCMSSTECGPGYECVNGGCCPLTPCPNGQIATQRCQGATQCCQGGQVCLNGVCCPLPLCSNGMMATSYCNDNRQCGPGMECAAGGCCPLPTCPSGGQASQRCYPGVGCPPGQFCDGGVCCPIPVCSNGMPSLQLCGIGNSCPLGFVCEGRGCCPEPMPLCPNGGRASRKCVRGSDCAPGFGCTVLGGCCLLSVEPVCPVSQSPVCQCSATNACPAQSTCLSGTCCTSALTAAYNRVPGTQCRSSTQCNGFNAECAACLQTTCVCTNGAASNGATCQQTPPQVLQMARTGCDEYGSPCRYTFSTARRKPIFAPVGNATEKPLWFHVAAKRKCVTDVKKPNYDPDNTCLPNEKCIKGECKMRLWPGEYGCSTDEECSSRCPNTYCSRNSDKNVPQCQCKGGMLLFGRCFVSCPDGFHQSGAYCKHDNEDAFWKDGQAQEKLKEVLNSGTC